MHAAATNSADKLDIYRFLASQPDTELNHQDKTGRSALYLLSVYGQWREVEWTLRVCRAKVLPTMVWASSCQ